MHIMHQSFETKRPCGNQNAEIKHVSFVPHFGCQIKEENISIHRIVLKCYALLGRIAFVTDSYVFVCRKVCNRVKLKKGLPVKTRGTRTCLLLMSTTFWCPDPGK